MRRKGIPDGGCSMCCRLKQKLDELWQRTSGCILRIRGITPDGQGDFALEAGSNISITEVSNGVRIDTTGGVSYYTSGDQLVDVDNNDLKISLVTGNGGVALHDDLETVAQAVDDIVDGDITVPKATNADNATNAGYADNAGNATYAGNATNALYLGSASSNVGDDERPIKIVNGQAVAVTNAFEKKISSNNTASMFFSTASIQSSGQWNRQFSTSITIPANSPYFADDSGKIKILQAGAYIVVGRMANSVSQYEGIEIVGVNLFQNSVHNSQIAQIIPLNANDVIAGTLYGNGGVGSFEQYNALNRIDIIKL